MGGPETDAPAWVLVLVFAEKFGMPPELVEKTSLRWWYRWLEFESARAFRLKAAGKWSKMTPDEIKRLQKSFKLSEQLKRR